jgi:hypothetical protein
MQFCTKEDRTFVILMVVTQHRDPRTLPRIELRTFLTPGKCANHLLCNIPNFSTLHTKYRTKPGVMLLALFTGYYYTYV